MKSKRHPDALCGTVVGRSVVAGFTLTETAYAPSLRLPSHSHQSAYFCLVLQGSFTELHARGSRDCRPSTLIFHPPGERHSDYFHTAARCFNLLMDVRWVERVRQYSPNIESAAEFRGGILTQLAVKIYREFCQADALSQLIVEGLMLEILGEAARGATEPAGRQRPRWLVRAREVLHDRFCDDLSLAEVAKTVGIHETHLSREFRRHYHCTMGEYVRRLRIDFACRELSASDAPIAEVAQAVGFFDQSHFGRTFKRLTGVSPASYRKTFRAR